MFRHLTLQEYLAARELADHPERLIERYRSDPAAWREVVKLWCGGAIRDCTGVVKEVIRFGELHDQVLALECVADARHIDGAYAAEVISEFMDLLGEPGPESDSIISAFGAVAAAAGPRGRQVLAMLKEKATDWQAVGPSTRRAALLALSASGRPEAAEILVPLASADQDARIALRTMGELGIPALSARASTGDIQAIDDLAVIATPAAAEALAALLWQDEPAATRTAWWLAELLVSPDIEDGLRHSAISVERSAPVLDWIWRPFAGPEDRTLSMIVDRVGYLLDTSSEDIIPQSANEADVRVALPVAGLAIASKLRDRQNSQVDEKATDAAPGSQPNPEKKSKKIDPNEVPENITTLAREAAAHEGIQLQENINWADVDRVCCAAAQRQTPSRLADLLLNSIMAELALDKRYGQIIDRLNWPVRANLIGAAGNAHMRKVYRRDWLNVNRRPRPAAVAWGLHAALWALSLLGILGLAGYEQVQIIHGESSAGIISQIRMTLKGSSRRDWISIMGPVSHSWVALIFLGLSIVMFVTFIVARRAKRADDADGALLICGFLFVVVAVFDGVITWLTLLALIGPPASVAVFVALMIAFISTVVWGIQRSHDVANPLRRCLNAGQQSLRDRVSIMAE